MFQERVSIEEVEEGIGLAPKFDGNGLIPVVTSDVESGELLMHGYMNHEALEKTILTGQMHYFSRSRKVIWHKGATSGFYQNVDELMIEFTDTEKVFDPEEIYGDAPNPTKL